MDRRSSVQRRRRRTHPLVEVDVEAVERDVRSGDEDVLDGGVEALEHGEVEHPRGLRVHGQVRGHLPPARRRRRRHRAPAYGYDELERSCQLCVSTSTV
jgi:hypothetical protein